MAILTDILYAELTSVLLNILDANESAPGDTTAPTLSSISVVKTDTTATLSWSTDEGNGTAYWMVDGNASRTAAQIKSGGGTDSDSVSVTSGGAQTDITATGLTPSLLQYFHLMHEDAATNQSTASTTSFTTSAAFTVANQSFDRGDKTLIADSPYTFSATTGTIDSIGTPTGANVADWTISESAGVITAVNASGAPANGPYTLTVPCWDGPGQTGNLDNAVLTIATGANVYSVSDETEYDAVMSIATATQNGRTVRGETQFIVTPTASHYLNKTWATSFTITAVAGAKITFDAVMKLDGCTNLTIDGQSLVTGSQTIKFLTPEVSQTEALEFDGACDNIVIKRCEASGSSTRVSGQDFRPRLLQASNSVAFQVGEDVTGDSSSLTAEIVEIDGLTLILNGKDTKSNQFTNNEGLSGSISGSGTAASDATLTTEDDQGLAGVSFVGGDFSACIASTFQDNWIHGYYTGGSIAGLGNLLVQGNRIEDMYEDGFGIRSIATTYNTSSIFDQNVMLGFISKSTDHKNPHSDGNQYQNATNPGAGSGWEGHVITGNILVETNVTDGASTQGLFGNLETDRPLLGALIEGNLLVTNAGSCISFDENRATMFCHNTCVSMNSSTFTPKAVISAGGAGFGSMWLNNLVDNAFPDTLDDYTGAQLGQKGSVAGDYSDTFVGDGVGSGGAAFEPTTEVEAVAWFTPLSGVKGATAVMTFSTTSPGHDGTLDTTKRPAPTYHSTGLSPLDGATAQAASTDPKITLREIIEAGTGNITVFDASDDSTIEAFNVATEEGTGSGQVEFTGEVVTLHMTANFTAANVYIQVDSTAITGIHSGKDFAGISNKTDWNFGVNVSDVTAPVFLSGSPADGGTDVAITTNPTITFTEAGTLSFGTTKTFTIRDVTGAADEEVFSTATDIGSGPGKMSISGNTVTLEPTSDLTNGNNYSIRWVTGAVKDQAANDVAANSTDTLLNWATVSASSGVSLIHTDFDGDTSSSSAYTFDKGGSGLNFGTATATRKVFVALECRGSITLNSVTIGGQTGAICTDGTTSATLISGADQVEIWWALVTADEGGGNTVVTSSTGSPARMGINVWSGEDIASGNVSSVVVASEGTQTGLGPIATITIPADGAIMAASAITGNSVGSLTWTSSVTADNSRIVESDFRVSVASKEHATLQTGVAVEPQWSGEARNQVLVCVALAKA